MHSSATHNSYVEIQITIFIAKASKVNDLKMIVFFFKTLHVARNMVRSICPKEK